MDKDIGKNKSKSFNSKYSQKLHHAKQSATDAIITSSNRVTQKTSEATNDLISDMFLWKKSKILLMN